MVATQIAARGLTNPRLLAVFEAVPRHLFVPAAERAAAYYDEPLPIGFGQTISQPYIVALMTDLVGAADEQRKQPMTLLEVGSGSGYQAAILAALGHRVVTLERLAPLADRARLTLTSLGVKNVEVLCRDGSKGAADLAPPGGFDGILVAAASPIVPQEMLEQLAIGGRLVIPVGPTFAQDLMVYERRPEGYVHEVELPVRFVPLVS